MAIRINIDWDFMSPTLRRASGIVKVEEHQAPPAIIKTILKCRCYVEDGCSGFKSMEGEGIPTKTFDLFEEHIRGLMRSFFDGMLLRNQLWHWLPETLKGDGTLEEWRMRQKIIGQQLKLEIK